MQWINRNYASVHDAVDEKTHGLADEFLHPVKEYSIPNGELMAQELSNLARNGTPITIIGDYDTDGVCASAELKMALLAAGAKSVRVRLPLRLSEGYGLNKKIVEEVKSGAIVTVDNGIAAIDAISEAKKKGILVYVIDHHLPIVQDGQARLPDADLIVDPNAPDQYILKEPACEPVYRGYCGAGLVCRIAEKMIPGSDCLPKISSLAAIATIADVVPLTGDNRNLYHEGIEHIRRGEVTAGLQAIIDMTQTGNILNESDIGFKIAPMLNAPGRLEDRGANASLKTVLSEDRVEAAGFASCLESFNENRKKLKEEAVQRAIEIMTKENLFGKNPIVLFDPLTPEGVLGLVAGELSERYRASSFALTESKGFLKGSARSSGRDNIKEALDKVNSMRPDIFVGYGGHSQAAGLTIRKDKMSLFASLMQKVMTPWEGKADTLYYDMEISAGQIVQTAADLQPYAPFGNSNPQITFCVRNFKLVPDGKDFFKELKGNTVRFRGAGCEAFGFDRLNVYKDLGCLTEMDLICSLSYHAFNGKVNIQAEVLDMKPPKHPSAVSSGFNRSLSETLKQFNIG